MDQKADASEQALSAKGSRLDRHSGRALDLDSDDLSYQNYGGIERVRRRLLCKALEELKSNIVPIEEDQVTASELVQSLLDVLSVEKMDAACCEHKQLA